MKKLILFTLSLVLLEAANAQTQKNESARSRINASSQNQLTRLINLTNEQSEFDNLLNESYKSNKARLNEWKVKANDKSLNFNQRAFYEKQIPRYEAAVEGIFKMRLSMLQANHFLSHPNTTIKSPDQNSTSNCYPASENSTSEIASSNFDEFNNVLQKLENAISLVDKHEKLLDNEFQTKTNPLRPRAFGGKGAEGLKKGFPRSVSELAQVSRWIRWPGGGLATRLRG